MVNYPSQASPIDNDFHPTDSGLEATNDHWGTKVAEASVTPLHPPGTFARNTQSGDVVNGMAQQLGIKNPNNVIKFPKK